MVLLRAYGRERGKNNFCCFLIILLELTINHRQQGGGVRNPSNKTYRTLCKSILVLLKQLFTTLFLLMLCISKQHYDYKVAREKRQRLEVSYLPVLPPPIIRKPLGGGMVVQSHPSETPPRGVPGNRKDPFNPPPQPGNV